MIEGALNGARIAYKLIDMTKQKGEHPRLGALDVCPFIPVQNVEMEECIYCARKFAQKLSLELNVPVLERPRFIMAMVWYLFGKPFRCYSKTYNNFEIKVKIS